jgi:hypothetical protein
MKILVFHSYFVVVVVEENYNNKIIKYNKMRLSFVSHGQDTRKNNTFLELFDLPREKKKICFSP